MVQKFVYPPEQQAQFEQLQAEIDELLRNLLALKQHSPKQEITLNSSALPPDTLVLLQSY